MIDVTRMVCLRTCFSATSWGIQLRMASNGRCDGSTGGREPLERRPDMVLVIDRRRLVKIGRPVLDMKDLLPKLSAEPDGVLTRLRENELGVVAGMSFAASS